MLGINSTNTCTINPFREEPYKYMHDQAFCEERRKFEED